MIYTFLGKGYVDAVGAHEESIIQYMKDYNMELRILDEPLMTVGLELHLQRMTPEYLPEIRTDIS